MTLNANINETIIKKVRRHWVVFALRIVRILFGTLFLMIITTALGGFVFARIPQVFEVVIFTNLFLVFCGWSLAFLAWVDYFLDVWVLTPNRIYDIEQHAFFSREVAEFRLDRIQDITVDIHGLIPTFFNFGDVRVQTAGTTGEFIIKNAPDPYKLRDAISKEVDKHVQNPLHRTSSL